MQISSVNSDRPTSSSSSHPPVLLALDGVLYTQKNGIHSALNWIQKKRWVLVSEKRREERNGKVEIYIATPKA